MINDPRKELPTGDYLIYAQDTYDALAQQVSWLYYIYDLGSQSMMRLDFPGLIETADIHLYQNASKLAYSDAEGIHLYNLDSGEIQSFQLPEEMWLFSVTGWSPKGDKITMSVFNYKLDKHETIYWLDPETGALNGLTNWRGAQYSASWSPDGQWFTLSSDHAKFDGGPGYQQVYMMEASCLSRPDTCIDQAFLIGDISVGGFTMPDWSPDSKYLSYTCDMDDDDGICLIDIAQRKLEKFLSIDLNYIHGFVWSPDGEKTAFFGSQNYFDDLYVMSVDTGEYVKITQDTKELGREFISGWIRIEK